MNLSEQALGLTFTPEVDEHVYRDGKSLSSFSAHPFRVWEAEPRVMPPLCAAV